MHTDSILVVNAGSSSLKFSLYRGANSDELQLLLRGQIDGVGTQPRLLVKDATGTTISAHDYALTEVDSVPAAIAQAAAWLREQYAQESLRAIGHRVVHGGAEYARPVRVDDAVIAALEKLIPLAPLHQPHNLAAIRSLRDTQPGVPQVACFDTGFHRSHSRLADLYALPYEYYTRGIRRYGFHGISYEYIASVLPQLAPAIAKGRVIVAHLGSGASLCALCDGKSVDSTMGFSPLDGLPMGTRPGQLDPGVLLHLLEQHGMTAAQLEQLLYHESGLLGLSNLSSDMRVLLDSSEPHAQLAIDYFVHHVAKQIGALTAVLGGLDALVFTAGIGEHSAAIRERIMQACAWLGMKIDPTANQQHALVIAEKGSAVPVFVIPTNEELMIAQHTQALLAS